MKKPLNLVEVEGEAEVKERFGRVRRSRVALATETRRAIGFEAESIVIFFCLMERRGEVEEVEGEFVLLKVASSFFYVDCLLKMKRKKERQRRTFYNPPWPRNKDSDDEESSESMDMKGNCEAIEQCTEGRYDSHEVKGVRTLDHRKTPFSGLGTSARSKWKKMKGRSKGQAWKKGRATGRKKDRCACDRKMY